MVASFDDGFKVFGDAIRTRTTRQRGTSDGVHTPRCTLTILAHARDLESAECHLESGKANST